jgi:signal peptidase
MKRGKVITFIVTLVILVLLGNIIFRWVSPIKPVKLESESMSPAYEKGDVLFYKNPSSLNIGDVIIFKSNARFDMVARIAEINSDGTYRTKGDNNEKSLNPDNNLGGLDETQIQKTQIYGKIVFKSNPYVFSILSYGLQIVIALALTNPIYNKVNKK